MALEPHGYPEIPRIYRRIGEHALPIPEGLTATAIDLWTVTELVDDTPPSEIVIHKGEFKTYPSDRLLDLGHPYELTRHAETLAQYMGQQIDRGLDEGALTAEAKDVSLHIFFATDDSGLLRLRDIKASNGWRGWMHTGSVGYVAAALEIPAVPIYSGHMSFRDLVFRALAADSTEDRKIGLIAEPAVQFYDRNGERVIYKLIFADFEQVRQEVRDALIEAGV